jgi:hypothetical protein
MIKSRVQQLHAGDRLRFRSRFRSFAGASLKAILLRLPLDMWQRLATLAGRRSAKIGRRVAVAELIREAITQYLTRLKGERKR